MDVNGTNGGGGGRGTTAVAPAPDVARDISSIVANDWPARALPAPVRGERRPSFQGVIDRKVLDEIHAHGRSAPDVEVCGVLLGNVHRDGGGAPYLWIDASIRGNHAAGKAAQVTFTSETWNHINDEKDRDHPDKRIVGWYHTHPGFGIFLSDMDVFIQRHFFPEPWQVAFVYDPRGGDEGLFVWRRGETTREEFLIAGEHGNDLDDSDEAAVEFTAPATPASAAPVPPHTVAELSARVQSLEQRQKWLAAALMVAALLALVWPLLLFVFLPNHSDPVDPTAVVGEP